ncbi:MAG TPA: hypothetical protein VFC60_01685 [Tissierellaceae bacterium]|nr:hypothetical protein [Tissierellaceae bacterium]
MKKFFEALKDFLYDSVDYIIVLSILAIVVVIIGWRIDLLFANDEPHSTDNEVEVVDNNIDNEPIYDDLEDEDMGNQNDSNGNPDTQDDTIEEPTIVKISIPPGSLPSNIGSILEDKGLILSKNDFVLKSQELKLDTKLKSGDFDISTDSTIEDIIYIISK